MSLPWILDDKERKNTLKDLFETKDLIKMDNDESHDAAVKKLQSIDAFSCVILLRSLQQMNEISALLIKQNIRAKIEIGCKSAAGVDIVKLCEEYKIEDSSTFEDVYLNWNISENAKKVGKLGSICLFFLYILLFLGKFSYYVMWAIDSTNNYFQWTFSFAVVYSLFDDQQNIQITLLVGPVVMVVLFRLLILYFNSKRFYSFVDEILLILINNLV